VEAGVPAASADRTPGTVERQARMSSTDRTWESPASFAERIWPVIDVYGRVRLLVEGERQATSRPLVLASDTAAIA
jgi:hypothetical protein